MKVKVKCFAWARDATGKEEVEAELEGDASVGSLLKKLAEDYPRLGERLSTMAVSVNQEFARPDEPISEGDEIALIPPISGGGAHV
ncbi:MAG: molybdopterin converting factor subunit 1 [Nitrospinota bacterium]